MLAFFSNWIIFFPVAFSLFVALRLTQARRDDVRPTLTVLVIRLTVLMFFLFAFLSIGIRASTLSIIWVVLLAVMGVIFWWKNRRLDRSAMLLTVMGAGDDQQRLSLARTFYENNTGFVKRRAHALHRSLSSGWAWPVALEHSHISTSVYQRLAARLQWRYGQARASMTADHWGSPGAGTDEYNPLYVEQEIERSLGRLMIFSWVLLSIPVVVYFMRYLLPTLVDLLDEMSVDSPPVLQLIIRTYEAIPALGWLGILGFGPLALLGSIAVVLLLWIFPPLTRLPLIRWLFGDYYRNVGFTALAKTASLEPDLVQACDATAAVVPIAFVAERYRVAAAKLNSGMRPVEAFIGSGLLTRREAAAMDFALESRNMSWGLQQLANWRIERMLRRFSIMIQVLIVVFTVLLAIIVGIIAAGLLQSLSVMILRLSEVTW